jgi:hypothetical protein
MMPQCCTSELTPLTKIMSRTLNRHPRSILNATRSAAHYSGVGHIQGRPPNALA